MLLCWGGTEHESWMSYRFSPVPGEGGLVCPAVIMAIYYSPPQLCQEARRQSWSTLTQHADDTSLHVKTCQKLHAAIVFSILPFSRARGSSLIAGGRGPAGLDPQTGVIFVKRSVCQTLGDPSTAAEGLLHLAVILDRLWDPPGTTSCARPCRLSFQCCLGVGWRAIQGAPAAHQAQMH